MAEPSKTTDASDGGAPRASVTDGARTPHDRELPVNNAEADRPSHRQAAQLGEDSQRSVNGGAGEPANADPAAEALTEDQVKLALRRVKDPELNLNILDLG